jgi:quercetin dioxygenase-like cupin family protein
MTTNRHCDEVSEFAALYALGKLSEADAGSFERRLESGCSLCLAELETHQRTAEILLSATAVTPEPSLEERLMRRIELPATPPAASPDASPANPEILRAGEAGWVESPDPGVSYRFLHGKRTLLVRMDPGAGCSRHEHSFDEHCLVLEGTVEDGDTKLSAGDFLFMPAGSVHTPSHTGTGCLLLIAYT